MLQMVWTSRLSLRVDLLLLPMIIQEQTWDQNRRQGGVQKYRHWDQDLQTTAVLKLGLIQHPRVYLWG